MAARTSSIGTFNNGDVWAASHINSLPGGCLAYATRVTNSSAVSSQANITSLAVTVTFNASRLVQLDCWISAVSASDTSTWGLILILEGSTTLAYAPTGAPDSAGLGTGPATFVRTLVTPSAGSHTYQVAIDRGGGTGTVTAAGASDRPMLLTATDVGPAF